MAYPIVKDETFILATRDTGYRSTAAAIAELVDNAIQAGATSIEVIIHQDVTSAKREVIVAVLDNGCGMDGKTLRTALQFGGSSRFNDRSGQGRYGMGLPNSSLSQARRVDVYTWQRRNEVIHSYLDVDEIISGSMKQIPSAKSQQLPKWFESSISKTGTVVVWTRCDRLDHRKASTIAESLTFPLGRKFRYFLWSGVQILINGKPIKPFDPLYLHKHCTRNGATPFQKPLTVEMRVPTDPKKTSVITVRFSELPVSSWHDLPAEEKRDACIVKGAGVSIIRANREVDYGWHFMGNKRKENYDDWWRCEVVFEPILDELFGVTHSKQSINPTSELRQLLSSSLEPVAHVLNSRVRSAYQLVKAPDHQTASEVATARESNLPPINDVCTAEANGHGRKKSVKANGAIVEYKVSVQALKSAEFYLSDFKDGTIQLIVNRNHPFYSEVYEPASKDPTGRHLHNIECLLLAAARSDFSVLSKNQDKWCQLKRRSWSDALAAFLGG